MLEVEPLSGGCLLVLKVELHGLQQVVYIAIRFHCGVRLKVWPAGIVQCFQSCSHHDLIVVKFPVSSTFPDS